MWNTLWQMILGKELERRLDRFPGDSSRSGFTPKVLTTLMVADLWLSNVKLVLASKAKEMPKVGDSEAPSTRDDPQPQPSNDPYNLQGNDVQIHSLVHERQVEGLLRFAELMRWPFMDETRQFAEDVYGNLRSGSKVQVELWDWLFGTVLPGKWFAFKVMAALVLATLSLASIGVSKYFNSGLSLDKKCYWRSRTVLGRVLGSMPGVKTISGWIGPCIAVDGPKQKYIQLKARRVAPPLNDDVIRVGGYDPDEGEESLRPKPNEDIHAYMAEVMDEIRWTTPEPPILQTTMCKVDKVRLKALPFETETFANGKNLTPVEIEEETEYRASIDFIINDSTPVTYTLYTNPIFITAPPCYEGPHRVHARELAKFHRNSWNVDDLKDATAENYDAERVLVINATGQGAETLARAWCSERGKSAIIRRSPGPCYTCAYNAASTKGLGVNVLIWVS
jgi:hypothetical protein